MTKKLNCIMLIDDDEPTNFLSRIIIEEAGCARHLQIEDSGERALAYLASSKEFGYDNKACPWPDLILLDINMPAMNGWEFLDSYKELMKADETKTIIVMLTTSLNPDDQVKAGKISEVAGFEIKPLTAKLLDRVISMYTSVYDYKLTQLLP
ncbi:MAG: response regulator [Ginsengibacter sp.]